jgi:hypothetical protein
VILQQSTNISTSQGVGFPYTLFFFFFYIPSRPMPVLYHLYTKNFDEKKLDMLTNCQPEFIKFIRNLNDKYVHSRPPNTAKHFSL